MTVTKIRKIVTQLRLKSTDSFVLNIIIYYVIILKYHLSYFKKREGERGNSFAKEKRESAGERVLNNFL